MSGYGFRVWCMGPNAADIVGYTYAADTWCGDDCVINAMGEVVPLSDDSQTEAALDEIASRRGIDREDEPSYDSGDFPKVVFGSQVESTDERCAGCGEPLIGD